MREVCFHTTSPFLVAQQAGFADCFSPAGNSSVMFTNIFVSSFWSQHEIALPDLFGLGILILVSKIGKEVVCVTSRTKLHNPVNYLPLSPPTCRETVESDVELKPLSVTLPNHSGQVR